MRAARPSGRLMPSRVAVGPITDPTGSTRSAVPAGCLLRNVLTAAVLLLSSSVRVGDAAALLYRGLGRSGEEGFPLPRVLTESWEHWTPGQHDVWVGTPGGAARRYVLFVPKGYNPSKKHPLWLAFPGTGDAPEDMMSQTGMVDYATKNNITIAALQGDDLSFNVEAHGQPLPDRPDDVQYTIAVLRDVAHKLNVDRTRIRCVGFSRGARFCSRLASEMSSFISAIAPVGGIRFPVPNNATRPVPIIAFHGTKDPVNPFWGHGAGFWTESVPDAVHKWVHHNGCKSKKREDVNNVIIFEHSDCDGGADVFFVQVNGGGHTWPGSGMPTELGAVTHDITATVDIGNFFRHHHIWKKCRTVTSGEACYSHANWGKTTGIYAHPEWYPGLTGNSTFEDFQAFLYWNFEGNCPKPCPPTTTTTHTTTTTTKTVTQTSLTSTATTSTVTTTTVTTTSTTPWVLLQWIGQLDSEGGAETRQAKLGGSRILPVGGVCPFALAVVLFVMVAWNIRPRARVSRWVEVHHSISEYIDLLADGVARERAGFVQ